MINARGTPMTVEQTVQLLQQMQMAGLLNPAASGDQSQPQAGALLNDETLRNVVFSTREANSGSPFGMQPSGGYGDVHTPRASVGSSFSPFSPDPNLFTGGDPPSQSAPKKPELLYHPGSSTGFAQGFPSGPAVPHDVSNTMGANGKVATPRYTQYYDMPAAATISRPSSGSLNTTHPERQEFFEIPGHDHDVITDLNGTLASLDLDSTHHHQSSTPAPTLAAWNTPGSSSPSA
ncbi:hypothetical protein EI94DRAFT_650478 [Lactarius quietus]|nr:hypothetical protein EI94DRAFT_650478 [Lactarius quietus]